MATGRVWSRFTKNMNGKGVKFEIKEVGAEHYNEVLKIFLDYYTPEEMIHHISGLWKNPECLEEYIKHYLGQAVSKNCQIDACFTEDDAGQSKIVAGSIMYLDKKGETKWNGEETLKLIKTKEMKAFIEMVIYMADAYYKDFRNDLSLDKFYDDVGVVVHKDYRGLGIAGELFKARMVTCEADEVPMAGAWMTSLGTQKIAAKLNWETVLELNYKDIAKKGGLTYEGTLPSAKFMVKKL